MNNYNYPKISFGSTIHISRLAYAKEVVKNLKLPSIDAPWTIYDAKYFKIGYSEYASYCTMGVIKNEFGDGFMFHLRPGSSKLDKIFKSIQKATQNLKYANPLTGILVGGNANYKPSIELYNTLQGMFKEFNIKYSALLGQYKKNHITPVPPYCNLYFNGPLDKYVICPQQTTPQKTKSSKLKELYELFDIIIINKNDNLKLD